MGLSFQSLAIRAKVGAAVSDLDTLNRGAATRTELAALMGDLKLKVGGAFFTTGTKVGVDTSPFIVDCG